MRLSRRILRLRVRRLHIVISGVVFCAIYVVLYQHTGINLPAAEIDGLLVDSPLRFRVADGWAWKDDIDYSRKFNKVLAISPEKSDSNQTASDELPPSVVQDPGVDDAQGRYELEGVEDYILWHDGYLETTKNQVNRKIRSCNKPIQDVLFLKTHFTGSDVITNILNRFADLWNLRVALPSGGLSTFYWPSRFHWKYVDIMLLDGTLPNILCNHARFNGDVMDQIMQPQTAFITILRDPVTHFESTFRNLDFASVLEMEHLSDPYLTFMENPRKYIGRTIQRKRFKDSLNLIKNGMFFDLGLRTTDYHKPKVVQDAILDIDDKFTVVLIFEYLDESLVLMKRKLCWELDDILYLRLHYQLQGENSHKTTNANITEQIHRWNKADVALYQYFNETLWKDIQSEEAGFSEELADFRTKHKAMERECLGDFDFTDFTQIDLNPNVSSINRYLCEKMLFREFEYLHYFRQKMENSKKHAFVDGIGQDETETRFVPEYAQGANESENKTTRKSAHMNKTRHSSAMQDR